MTHPANIAWIHYTVCFSDPQVQVGWRGEDDHPKSVLFSITQRQASQFAIAAQNLVAEGKASSIIMSSGWSIYPKDPIPDVAALWS